MGLYWLETLAVIVGVIACGYTCLFLVGLVLVFVVCRLWFVLLIACYCLCCVWVRAFWFALLDWCLYGRFGFGWFVFLLFMFVRFC